MSQAHQSRFTGIEHFQVLPIQKLLHHLFISATRLPEFLQKPEDMTAPLGEDAKFQVTVDGEPKPDVKWFAFTIDTYQLINYT